MDLKNLFQYCVLPLFLGLLYSCEFHSKSLDKLELQDQLEGKWEAKAFNGYLKEAWHLSNEGWMIQNGVYVEKGDTLYEATTKIEEIGNELILISVIKDASPKVFKSIDRSSSKIIFENKDYKNPYRVEYEFISPTNYKRTIEGLEQDSLVKYEFEFKRK